MTIRRLLTIDGGGIKGVIPAAFLATLERATDKRLLEYFDLIVGTSTGGIIALGLGLGLSAEELLDFYEREGPTIFGQGEAGGGILRRLAAKLQHCGRSFRQTVLPKHRPEALRAALEGAFGDKQLGDCQTRVVVPAFDRQRRDIHIFKTAHHERLRMDWRERAVEVAMATAAAPTYLPSHRLGSGVSLIDGGVWANNPVGLAVVEAITILGWEASSLRVLSLGCSESPFHIPEDSGFVGLAAKLADVFMVGQSRSSYGTAKLLMGPTKIEERLFRYQPITGSGEFQLDDTDKIGALKGIGAALARQALPQVQQVFLGNPREPFVPEYGQNTSDG